MGIGGKSCFSVKKQKQMISTSEQRAEHPFAGQNTQQTLLLLYKRLQNLDIYIKCFSIF